MDGKWAAWVGALFAQAGEALGPGGEDRVRRLAGVALALAVVFWILRRVARRLRRRAPRATAWNPELDEDLGSYGRAWERESAGGEVLTAYHLPTRLRLVVAAPLGVPAPALERGAVAKLVDVAVPGLAKVIEAESPRIKVWPAQVSAQGFVSAFFRHTHVPRGEAVAAEAAEEAATETGDGEGAEEPEVGALSPWILVAGRMQCGYQHLVVGLALEGRTATGIGRVTIESPHQWLDILRVKPAEAAG